MFLIKIKKQPESVTSVFQMSSNTKERVFSEDKFSQSCLLSLGFKYGKKKKKSNLIPDANQMNKVVNRK